MGDLDTYDVFFSYSWRDHVAVEAVARALRQQGLNVFLDRWYLIPGRPWPQALEEVIASCRSVAVFVGPYGMGPWQQREKYLAISRQTSQPDFPVIPVLLPEADPALGFLSQNTWVDLRQRPDDPLSLAILQAAVRGEPPGPDLARRVQATLAAVCPYRGLSFFREEDAPFFFGRDIFIKLLDAAVTRLPVVAVVGASGCGKSSVVRAGLIPHLRLSPAGQVWDALTVLPGARPLQALAAALMPLLEPEMTEVDRLAEVNKLAHYFQTGGLALRDVAARVLARQPGTHRLLLVVDQAEELYTLTREDETRRRFLDEVLEAANTGPLTALFTLRGDFFGQALSYRALADQLQDAVVNLGPLTRQELRQAVEEPARKVALEFETGLVPRILDDVGDEPGNLPLLEFALTSLWEARQGNRLLHEAYEAMGCVPGAMAQRAERVFDRLSPLEQQAAPRVFKELIRPGQGTDDTRRRATVGEVGEAAWPLVRQLADARLLVTARDATTGTETVEVAHEALIRHWDRLKGWLDADREFLLWRQRLRGLLQEWEHTNQDAGVLLRGALLAEARGWLSRRPGDLSEAERQFIQASVVLKEQEEAERHEKQRRELAQAQALAAEQQKRAATERLSRRRLSVLAVALLVAFLGAIGAAVFAWVQRNHALLQERLALEQSDIAFSRQLAAQASTLLDSRLDLALLLSVEAYQVNPTLQARNSLLGALQRRPRLTRYLHSNTDVTSLAFSPDGRTLASKGVDQTIILWDVATRQPLGPPLTGHQTWVSSLAFSPDGRTLASGSGDKTIIVWDVASRQTRGAPLTGHQDAVTDVAFSPDGRTLASGSMDKTIRLWDVATRQPLGPPLTGHQTWVSSLAFSPDGRTLASGSMDKTIRLWDVTTRQTRGAPLIGQQDAVTSVAFSPDGKTLASGSGDKTIILWDVATRQPRGEPLTGHQEGVTSLAFSPDGQTLASGSWDKTIILWDVATRQPRGEPLTGHQHGVKNVAFSPDGRTLASGSIEDETIIVWDVATRQPRGAPLTGHQDEVTSLAFSPDGQTLASGSGDKTIIVWDVATRQPRGAPLTGHQAVVRSVAFSPDGRTLASRSEDKTIILWDVATRQPWGAPLTLTGNQNLMWSLAFSPDGQTLASGSSDQIIILWDVPTRQPRGEPLTGHQEGVTSLTFSPDGRTLASGGWDGWDKTIILWDVATRQPRGAPLTLTGALNWILSLAFSPDGQTLASGSMDKTIRLWDVATRQPLGPPLTGHQAVVTSVAFSPDGQTLASGSWDKTIRLWDLATRQPLGPPLTGHQSAVNSVAFSPDGRTLASGSEDKTIILWDVDVKSWLKRACAIANRNLNKDEWQHYMGDRPYRKTIPDLPGPGE